MLRMLLDRGDRSSMKTTLKGFPAQNLLNVFVEGRV